MGPPLNNEVMMSTSRRDLDALLNDATMAELSGNAERALAAFDAAIQLGPLDPRVYMGRCSVLRRMGRHEEAASCAAAYASALPGDASAHHELGLSLLHLKRYKEAASALEKALALQPSFRAAWSNMGIALARLGDMDKAMACYDRAAGKAPLLTVPATTPSRARQFDNAVHEVLAGMMDFGGGCVHIVSERKFSFRVSVALLVALLEDYDLDGVAVSLANPSAMYQKALEKRVATKHPPYYIDVLASPARTAPPASPARAAPVAPSTPSSSSPASSPRLASFPAGENGAFEVSAFELDRIASAVKTGLQKVAERYGGEEHFVVLDDIASVEAFNGPQAVQRFMREFFSDLARLNIFCFAVLPDKKGAVLDISSFFSRREKLRVKSEWFTG
jgi:tetratricopeptide (TPR) repeat protein